MRMSQKTEIVAVNFEDLALLEATIFKILEGICHTGGTKEIFLRFLWSTKSSQYEVDIYAKGSSQYYSFNTPNGITVFDWVDRIVITRLKCHLVKNFTFYFEEKGTEVRENGGGEKEFMIKRK